LRSKRATIRAGSKRLPPEPGSDARAGLLCALAALSAAPQATAERAKREPRSTGRSVERRFMRRLLSARAAPSGVVPQRRYPISMPRRECLRNKEIERG
jgi:hypothetical protein